LNLLPTKNQWNTWSLPSKLTAIGTLLGFLSLGLYFLEKTFNVLDWILQENPIPVVSVDLQFPYERSGESVKQNKRNPQLTITNSGPVTISPITVDANMFGLSPSLDEAISAFQMAYRTHGHLILEPELKPGSSVTASLAGIKNWAHPAAYNIRIEMIRPSDNKKFTFSSLFLIDENGIKAEGSKLSKEKAQKIQAAILIFTNSVDTKKKLTLTAPLDGIWVPHVEPGVEFRINEDGTATVR
jgi:hypothetical protein